MRMRIKLGYYVPLRESGPPFGADRNQFGELENPLMNVSVRWRGLWSGSVCQILEEPLLLWDLL